MVLVDVCSTTGAAELKLLATRETVLLAATAALLCALANAELSEDPRLVSPCRLTLARPGCEPGRVWRARSGAGGDKLELEPEPSAGVERAWRRSTASARVEGGAMLTNNMSLGRKEVVELGREAGDEPGCWVS